MAAPTLTMPTDMLTWPGSSRPAAWLGPHPLPRARVPLAPDCARSKKGGAGSGLCTHKPEARTLDRCWQPKGAMLTPVLCNAAAWPSSQSGTYGVTAARARGADMLRLARARPRACLRQVAALRQGLGPVPIT